MNRIEKFFSLAAEEAKQSDMHYKHGAVIVKGGHVVAKGHNSRRSRVEGENYCSTHAEMNSLYRFEAGSELFEEGQQQEEQEEERQ